MKALFIIGMASLILYILLTAIFLIRKWNKDIKNISDNKQENKNA